MWCVLNVVVQSLTYSLTHSLTYLLHSPEQPVAQKGEWPKIVMDGLCRAQGRVGTPKRGNPPRMYTLLRYRNDLEHVCMKAETRALPPAYPPTILLGTHVRAQLSAALCLGGRPGEGSGTAQGIDAKAASLLGTAEAFVETKYDGFR